MSPKKGQNTVKFKNKIKGVSIQTGIITVIKTKNNERSCGEFLDKTEAESSLHTKKTLCQFSHIQASYRENHVPEPPPSSSVITGKA